MTLLREFQNSKNFHQINSFYDVNEYHEDMTTNCETAKAKVAAMFQKETKVFNQVFDIRCTPLIVTECKHLKRMHSLGFRILWEILYYCGGLNLIPDLIWDHFLTKSHYVFMKKKQFLETQPQNDCKKVKLTKPHLINWPMSFQLHTQMKYKKI